MGYLYFLLLLVLLLLLLLQQVDRKYLPVDAGEGDEAARCSRQRRRCRGRQRCGQTTGVIDVPRAAAAAVANRSTVPAAGP